MSAESNGDDSCHKCEERDSSRQLMTTRPSKVFS